MLLASDFVSIPRRRGKSKGVSSPHAHLQVCVVCRFKFVAPATPVQAALECRPGCSKHPGSEDWADRNKLVHSLLIPGTRITKEHGVRFKGLQRLNHPPSLTNLNETLQGHQTPRHAQLLARDCREQKNISLVGRPVCRRHGARENCVRGERVSGARHHGACLLARRRDVVVHNIHGRFHGSGLKIETGDVEDALLAWSVSEKRLG